METSSEKPIIDGCPINCARQTLELAGVRRFEHLALHELGLRKEHCPATDDNIVLGAAVARQRLASAGAGVTVSPRPTH